MLELKTKPQLAKDAFVLAGSLNLVRYRSVTYIPADFETRETATPPDIDRTIWLPLSRDDHAELARDQFKTLFGNDSELTNFCFMVAQSSIQKREAVTSLLVRTAAGLRELTDDGELIETSGEFRPNAIVPMLNEDKTEKDRVFDWIVEILGGEEEEAHSLLYHLATSLSPGWSAVKYVLLLGDGRNGKSLLLKMMQGLYGMANVSNVTRQDIAQKEPTVTDLNGKLLNIVFDGQAEYLKDSGAEKTIIAGEPFSIRKLYESTPTIVQTTSLFIEGLQHEPKTKDKSTALQKRIVRFKFPNIYALDHKFERRMLKEESVGALLSLLIDHYVKEDELATKLAPTKVAMELQLEQMFSNSLGLQFLKFIEEVDPLGVAGALLGRPINDIVPLFKSWRVKEDDLGTWAEPDVIAQLQPLVNTERKSVRIEGTVRKVRVMTSLKSEAHDFIESLKGEQDGGEAVVDD